MALYTSEAGHTQRASGRGTGVGRGRHFMTLEGILWPDLGDGPAVSTYCVILVKSLTSPAL